MDLRLPQGIDRLPRHRERLEAACRAAMDDPDVVGMGIAGSFAEGEPDEYSDLDLRVVVEAAAFERKLGEAPALAEAAGPLVGLDWRPAED
jgi:predicted nucleotidyltransferase